MLEILLLISLSVNFLFLIILLYYKETRDNLSESLSLLSDPKIFGGKTAWYQFNYVLHSYVLLYKRASELEVANKELWSDAQASDPILAKGYPDVIKEYQEKRKIFSKDWNTVKFPAYGPKDLNKLMTEFQDANKMQHG